MRRVIEDQAQKSDSRTRLFCDWQRNESIDFLPGIRAKELLRQSPDDGIEQMRILKVGSVSRLLARNWLEARRERLIPFHRQRGNVSEDAFHLIDGDIAGQRNRIEAGAADRRVSEQRVNAVGRLSPALRERGLLFVGIDVIDGHLTEINVTSPTGIRAIARLGGPDVAAKIWDAIEARRAGK